MVGLNRERLRNRHEDEVHTGGSSKTGCCSRNAVKAPAAGCRKIIRVYAKPSDQIFFMGRYSKGEHFKFETVSAQSGEREWM